MQKKWDSTAYDAEQAETAELQPIGKIRFTQSGIDFSANTTRATEEIRETRAPRAPRERQRAAQSLRVRVLLVRRGAQSRKLAHGRH